jgi:hypothetical protein
LASSKVSQIFYGPQVSLDLPRLLLDGELVSKAVALGLPSFVVLRAIEIPTHL